MAGPVWSNAGHDGRRHKRGCYQNVYHVINPFHVRFCSDAPCTASAMSARFLVEQAKSIKSLPLLSLSLTLCRGSYLLQVHFPGLPVLQQRQGLLRLLNAPESPFTGLKRHLKRPVAPSACSASCSSAIAVGPRV